LASEQNAGAHDASRTSKRGLDASQAQKMTLKAILCLALGALIDMLWSIINAQNYQNHNMEAYLDAKGLPAIGASPAPEISEDAIVGSMA
jgi:hypothetical protein